MEKSKTTLSEEDIQNAIKVIQEHDIKYNTRGIEEFGKKWHELGIPNGCLMQMRDYHHQELQKAREQTIRDMERKMMGWSGTATAMLKDYRRIIYRDQSELDQPNK